MVRRKRENDLGWPGLEGAGGLLGLDVTEHAEKVGKHDTVGKLRLAVDVVDLTAVLRDGGEGNDEVEVPAKTLLLIVDPLNESVGVLLATLVEGSDNELGALGTVAGVHGLVVLGDLAPPLIKPWRTSAPMEPAPAPVMSTFLPWKVTPDLAASSRPSR